MTAQNKVWLVTGASGGLGLATVKELLAAGYLVAATARDVEKLRAASKRCAPISGGWTWW